MRDIRSRAKIVSGMSWLSGVRFLEKGFGLIRLVILARVLGPAEFGFFGAALLLVSLVEIATDVGLGEYLIRKPTLKPVDLGIAMIWNIGRMGVSLGILALVFTAVQIDWLPVTISSWYWAMIVAVLILKLISNPGLIEFRRNQNFDKLAIIRSIASLSDLIVSIIASIAMVSGLGLAIGMVVGLVVEFALGWLWAPRKMSIPKLTQLKKPFEFIRWTYLSNLLSYLLHQGDDWLVSAVYGPTWLGVYQAGYKYSLLPSSQVASSVSQVTYPMLRTKPQEKKLQFVVNMTWLSLYPSLLLASMVSVFSTQVVGLTLGDEWLSVATLLPLLMAYGVVKTMGSLLTLWFLDANRPDVATKLNVIRLATFILFCAFLIPAYQVVGVAWAVLLSTGIATIVLVLLLWSHHLDWRRLFTPWLVVGLGTVVVLLLRPWLPASNLTSLGLGASILVVVCALLAFGLDAFTRDLTVQEIIPRLPVSFQLQLQKVLYWARFRHWLQPRFREQATIVSDLEWQKTYDLQWQHDCHDSLTNTDVIWIQRELASKKVRSVLEIGPGTGKLAAILQKKFQVHLVDISRQALRLCQDYGLPGVQSRAETLGIQSSSCDVLIATHVLEHVSDVKKTLLEWQRVASRGVLIIVPLEERPILSANYHLQYFPNLESLKMIFGEKASYEECINPSDHKPYARIAWWWE